MKRAALHQQVDSAVRTLLASVFDVSESEDDAFVKAGMSTVELDRLYELVQANSCFEVLEIGMANGTSALVICHALSKLGKGSLTSVDPFQLAPDGYGEEGIRNLEKAGPQAVPSSHC